MPDTLSVLVSTNESCAKGHGFTIFTDESSPNWYWTPDFAANDVSWSFSIETEWVQSETEGSVAVGLVRSMMERRVCGGRACEVGDGEKGLRLGLWDRWWREGLWRKKEEMERQWRERHGEWNGERIKNKKVMWTQNKKLILFFSSYEQCTSIDRCAL